jgi:hypothetical protein
MKIQVVPHRHWSEVYCCSVGELELLVVTSIGPRIMSLRLNGGDNLLYEDGTGFSVEAWRLYGGHRFATAPECDASYTPDNDQCEVDVAEHRLRIRPPTSVLGLEKTLEIGPSLEGGGFEIRHVLTNTGTKPWKGAAWAITCVPAIGRVIVPLSPQAQGTSTPFRFWEGSKEACAMAGRPQWQAYENHLLIKPPGVKGKVGLYSDQGRLAHVQSGFVFLIESRGAGGAMDYPDEGCNVEVFTCRDFLELETLSPLQSLLPGESLVHLQAWRVWYGALGLEQVKRLEQRIPN